MTSPAPRSLAPSVAERPTAPWAKIATVPPTGMLAFSEPMSPVESMSQA